MNHSEHGVYKAMFTVQAKMVQIRFFFFCSCDSDLFFHNGVNSTNHMESDLFNSDFGQFRMWSYECLAARVFWRGTDSCS